MAKKTGAEYIDWALRKADKSSSDTSYETLALDWFNEVILDLDNRQASYHWRFLEKTATAPTVANQMTYDLPTDISGHKIIAIYDRTNDITYKFVPYEKFVKLVADPSTNIGSTQVFWTFFADTIRLYPVPSVVMTFFLDYIKRMTLMVNSTATIDVPEECENVVQDGFLVHAYKYDPELGDWAKQQAVYEASVIRMQQNNSQIISEVVRPTSHRERYSRRADIDGANSLYFPIDPSP